MNTFRSIFYLIKNNNEKQKEFKWKFLTKFDIIKKFLERLNALIWHISTSIGEDIFYKRILIACVKKLDSVWESQAKVTLNNWIKVFEAHVKHGWIELGVHLVKFEPFWSWLLVEVFVLIDICRLNC